MRCVGLTMSSLAASTTANNNRLFSLKTILSDDVVIESSQDQSQSPFFLEYQQAREIISSIIEENINLEKETDSLRCTSHKSNCSIQDRRIYNIISFIGERGTGKSSVMLSVWNYLCDYAHQENSHRLRADIGQSRPSFAVLHYIDASALKSHEDVIEIILSRMFKYARQVEQELNSSHSPVRPDGTRKLYQGFSSTYKALLDLQSGNTSGDDESALLRLQEMTSSYSLADKLRDLVKLFLDFLRTTSPKHYNTDPFLVIAIDDIDLYQPTDSRHSIGKNSYTLLEDIYELLMIPGIIVLTTFNESILQKNCFNHLLHKFEPESRLIDRTVSGHIPTNISPDTPFRCLVEPNYSSLLYQQMNEYLKKVLPADKRIYMPKLIVKDYPNDYRVKVGLPSLGEPGQPFATKIQKIFSFKDSPEISTEFSTKEPLAPKELMLNFIASAYGCFFDGQGNKLHFFEQRNLRQLKDQLLALMPRAKDANSEENNANFVQLFSFIQNQFSSEHLSEARELSLFRNWMQLPVERRSRDILAYIRTERNDKGFDGWKYSYGELLQSLYYSTRADSHGKPVFSKDMVSCLLASYSIVLPHLYQKALQGDTESEKSIRHILGSSITGRWSNEILYTKFYLSSVEGRTIPDRPTSQIGSVSYYHEIVNVGLDTPSVDGIYSLSDVLQWDLTELGLTFDILADGGSEATSAFRRFLHFVEVTCMLFTNVRSVERERTDSVPGEYHFVVIEKSPDKHDSVLPPQANLPTSQSSSQRDDPSSPDTTQPDTTHYLLQSTAKFACFNILNFVVNSFAWEDFFERLHSHLLTALVGFCTKYGTMNDAENDAEINCVRERIESYLDNYSLKTSYSTWSTKYKRCAIPFQHFDMTYNILKRLRNEIALPKSANTEFFFEHCVTVYRSIRSVLEKQDAFYSYVPHEKRIVFADAFSECPFIETILSSGQTDSLSGNNNRFPLTDADLKSHFEKMADHLAKYVWYNSQGSGLPGLS